MVITLIVSNFQLILFLKQFYSYSGLNYSYRHEQVSHISCDYLISIYCSSYIFLLYETLFEHISRLAYVLGAKL